MAPHKKFYTHQKKKKSSEVDVKKCWWDRTRGVEQRSISKLQTWGGLRYIGTSCVEGVSFIDEFLLIYHHSHCGHFLVYYTRVTAYSPHSTKEEIWTTWPWQYGDNEILLMILPRGFLQANSGFHLFQGYANSKRFPSSLPGFFFFSFCKLTKVCWYYFTGTHLTLSYTRFPYGWDNPEMIL